MFVPLAALSHPLPSPPEAEPGRVLHRGALCMLLAFALNLFAACVRYSAMFLLFLLLLSFLSPQTTHSHTHSR